MGQVPGKTELQNDASVKVINGRGRTLMSGMGDAHTHLTWNGDIGSIDSPASHLEIQH